MKIEVETLCDGLFIVYQEDEGVVNSVVLSSANIVKLAQIAFPEEAAKCSELLQNGDWASETSRAAVRKVLGPPKLTLVEKNAPQEAQTGT